MRRTAAAFNVRDASVQFCLAPWLSWRGGAALYDLSQYRRHGTVAFGAGGIRQGSNNLPELLFDAADTTATFGASFLGTGDITVEAVVSKTGSGEAAIGHICSSSQFSLYNAGTTMRVTSNAFTTQLSSIANSSPVGKTFHILITRQGAANAPTIFYLNGARISSGNSASGAIPADGGTFTVGNLSGGTVRTWQGNIAFVRVYSRLLSAVEASKNFGELQKIIGF